jgi:hypothetical protein
MEELIIIVTCKGGGYQASAYIPPKAGLSITQTRAASDLTVEGALNDLIQRLLKEGLLDENSFGEIRT